MEKDLKEIKDKIKEVCDKYNIKEIEIHNSSVTCGFGDYKTTNIDMKIEV